MFCEILHIVENVNDMLVLMVLSNSSYIDIFFMQSFHRFKMMNGLNLQMLILYKTKKGEILNILFPCTLHIFD